MKCSLDIKHVSTLHLEVLYNSYSTWLAPQDKAICLKGGGYKPYSG